jgi:hypothetical protein
MRISAFVLSTLLLAFAFGGCRKNSISTDPDAQLGFSRDTVFFDTVFTTIGSTTQLVKIYNLNNQAVVISSVDLVGGDDSNFQLNLDGLPGTSFSDIEIASGDSLWMFVEVTVDPSQQNLPFVVEDRVRFVTNGNEQFVELVAWGQDAHFHGGPRQLSVLPCSEVWNPDKPHVVYGIVAVDEGCSLTINAGTQVHCHARSGLYIYRGLLNVQGEYGNEVCFQGDRLEPAYSNIPGQWGIELAFAFETTFGVEEATVARGGIWLFECTGSTIDYAIIKNGNIGIQVDTTGASTADALRLTNTRIENMGVLGILGQGTNISGWNNLVTNCGQTCAAFTIGGRYQFAYSTFANYWSEGSRQAPAFILNNYYVDVNNTLQRRSIQDTWFHNCIFWGNNATLSNFNEFVVDMVDDELQDYRFEFCALDSDQNVADGLRYNGIINGISPPFVNSSAGNFHLSANATSLWDGEFTVAQSFLPLFDLDQVSRSLPGRKGCYEGQ